VEHNPDGTVSALDERCPGFAELIQAEVVGDERADIHRAPRDQLEPAPRNAPWVGQ
jgi:hypothetical protein